MDYAYLALLASLLWVGGDALAAGAPTHIAALKDYEIVLSDGTSGGTKLLASDPRAKWAFRWLPDGKRLSYLINGESGDKRSDKWRMQVWPRLVVVDTDGAVVGEFPLTPADNSSVPDSIRAIEEVEWLSTQLVRFEGSFGPRNCAVFELDISSGETLDEHDVECSSLTSSPDGKHVAYLHLASMGTWDDRVHRVEIDDGPLAPAGAVGGRRRPSVVNAATSYAGSDPGGPGTPVHLEAGPVWSEDSQGVAFLERQVPEEAAHGQVLPQPQYGQMALTTLSIRGEVKRVPLPAYTREDPTLMWIGDRVAVGLGDKALVVDPARGTYLPVDIDSRSVLQRVVDGSQQAAEKHKTLEDLVRKLGAREGVLRPD